MSKFDFWKKQELPHCGRKLFNANSKLCKNCYKTKNKQMEIVSKSNNHEDLSTGYILLYKRKKSWLTNIIKWATNSQYYHAEIFTEDFFGSGISGAYDIRLKNIATYKVVLNRDDFDVVPFYMIDPIKVISKAQELYINRFEYGLFNAIFYLFIKTLRFFKIRWFEGRSFMTCYEFCMVSLLHGLDIPEEEKAKIIPSLALPKDFIYLKYVENKQLPM